MVVKTETGLYSILFMILYYGLFTCFTCCKQKCNSSKLPLNSVILTYKRIERGETPKSFLLFVLKQVFVCMYTFNFLCVTVTDLPFNPKSRDFYVRIVYTSLIFDKINSFHKLNIVCVHKICAIFPCICSS